MAASTIPAVKAAFVTAIAANAAFSGVQVTYGHPGRNAEREFVFVGGTSTANQEWATLGAGQRSEEYALELFVSVLQPGADQRDVTERAFVLFAAIEALLRADPSLGLALTGVKALRVQLRPRRLIEGPVDDGRLGEIHADLVVDARI